MKTTAALAGQPALRRDILARLKARGPVAAAELAAASGVTREAVRQQLAYAREAGWVRRARAAAKARGAGRPTSLWALTEAGEHLFPKAYDAAAVEILDAVADRLGPDAVRDVLGSLADARFERLRAAMKGKGLAERLRALRAIYEEGDPFMSVEAKGGTLRLVERNCPFLNVALRRPALCSVTVSSLSRLIGCRVTREERFQDGKGRCVFRVHPEEPVDPGSGFAFEEEVPPA